MIFPLYDCMVMRYAVHDSSMDATVEFIKFDCKYIPVLLYLKLNPEQNLSRTITYDASRSMSESAVNSVIASFTLFYADKSDIYLTI